MRKTEKGSIFEEKKLHGPGAKWPGVDSTVEVLREISREQAGATRKGEGEKGQVQWGGAPRIASGEKSPTIGGKSKNRSPQRDGRLDFHRQPLPAYAGRELNTT